MKYLTTLAIILCCFTLSCEKSIKEDTLPETKKYNVNFSVSGFEQSVGTLSSTKKQATPKLFAVGDTLGNWADKLYYRIYNSAGLLVNTKEQSKNVTGFGIISDQLPTGSYKVLIVASKNYGGTYESSYFSDATTSFSNGMYRLRWSTLNYDENFWGDAFSKLIDLTIVDKDLSQEVRLDRVVGALEVNLEDAIPTGATKVTIVFQNESYFLYIKDNVVTSSESSIAKSFLINAGQIGQANQKFLMHISNTNTASNVIIRAYNAGNGLLAEKTVNNVRVYRNKKTTLTGKLFPAGGSTNQSSGFNVRLNPLWDTPPTTVNF